MSDEAIARLRRAALAVCERSWLQPSLSFTGDLDDIDSIEGYWVVPDAVMQELVLASTAVEVAALAWESLGVG